MELDKTKIQIGESLSANVIRGNAAQEKTVPRNLPRAHPWRLRLAERRFLLLAGDFLLALVSLVVALYFWALSGDRFLTFAGFIERRPPGWYFLLPFFWLLLMVELYDAHRAGSRRETVRGIAVAVLTGLMLYLFLYFTSAPRSLPRRGVAGFFIAASVLTLAWRMLYIRVFTASQFMRRVLLVGGGQAGQALLKITNSLWPPPFYLAGIIDDDPQKVGKEIEGLPVLGDSESLLEIIEEQNISDILVAIQGEMQGSMFQALLDAQERGLEITRMPQAYEELVGRVPIRLLEADWILRNFVDEARVSGFYELGKRLIDFIGGLVGSLLFLFLLPFITLATLLDSGRPIFYSQTRSGRGGQPYRIIKFRTMRQDAEANGLPQWAKEDDERATRVGRYLRKTHLDELPQFLNVLRGEMSLVGPRAERPELVEMFQKHVPFYRARLLVKPGITGWAQINFGYASTIDETVLKLEYDLYYIKHRSLWLDWVIMARTPPTVLGFRGR
jgi:exopolysaccharide biosynthesis polyprenyl glycosylphosphotransferase